MPRQRDERPSPNGGGQQGRHTGAHWRLRLFLRDPLSYAPCTDTRQSPRDAQSPCSIGGLQGRHTGAHAMTDPVVSGHALCCCLQTLMRVPAQLVEPRKVRLRRILLVRTWMVGTAVCLQPFGNDRPNFGREVKTDLLIVINPIDTLVFSHNNRGRTTYVRRFVACHTFLPAEPEQPVQRCASSEWSTVHAACGLHHAAYSTQHSAYKIHRTACSVPWHLAGATRMVGAARTARR